MTEHTTLKQRFFHAIVAGKIGSIEEQGIVVTQKEFKAFFKKQITTQYISSFLPAATIEKGQSSATHTRFVTRLRKGEYLVHNDALDATIETIIAEYVNKLEPGVGEEEASYVAVVKLI